MDYFEVENLETTQLTIKILEKLKKLSGYLYYGLLCISTIIIYVIVFVPTFCSGSIGANVNPVLAYIIKIVDFMMSIVQFVIY